MSSATCTSACTGWRSTGTTARFMHPRSTSRGNGAVAIARRIRDHVHVRVADNDMQRGYRDYPVTPEFAQEQAMAEVEMNHFTVAVSDACQYSCLGYDDGDREEGLC